MIGDYCREYRLSKNKTLSEIGGIDQVKNLSAFEHGRSSNIIHLIKYVELSIALNDAENFFKGLIKVMT